MAQGETLNVPWTTIDADSMTGRLIPAPAWMSVVGREGARMTLELRGVAGGGALSVRPAYQSTDNPTVVVPASAYTTFNASAITSMGLHYPTLWEGLSLSGAPMTNQLIRFGWVVKLTSATSRTAGRLAAKIELWVTN